ncbi:MAG: methionine--tRNA ligase [Verrucomicrobiae bacterium]|nr:methionine--tRNA ligase [Verrucomicrobiae bacterium]
MSKQFYITTAIDYVNGEPHLGHAYEKVITDVIARTHVALGEEVFYLTGLDEHGQKVEQAAKDAGMETQAYCDRLAASWQSFVKKLGLINRDFVRTTSPRHKDVVQAVLNRLNDKGEFYKKTYTGWYSAKEETFLTEKDRNEDGSFDSKWGTVTELEEDNYYFKLGEHQQWLIDHIESNPDFVQPTNRRNEVLGFLKNNKLEDLCSTRPQNRLSWGIPFPFDAEFVTYVWFDALTNYISIPAAHGDDTVRSALQLGASSGESLSLWPADVHVIGKDILKFHTVYWPIMLKAMGLPLPKTVLVHGWWQKDGEKMSKSTGNVVDPVAVIDEWGLDAFRYYVVRELGIGPDGNWTDESFSNRYSNELANGLGNLANRSLSMLGRYRDGIVPARHDELAEEAARFVGETVAHLKSHNLQAGLQSIWGLVRRANEYVDKTAPFKLAKDPTQSERLDEVLYNLTEVVRILGVLLWPFIPESAGRIFQQLQLEDSPDRLALAEWGGMKAGHQTGKPAPLFPRKDLAPRN